MDWGGGEMRRLTRMSMAEEEGVMLCSWPFNLQEGIIRVRHQHAAASGVRSGTWRCSRLLWTGTVSCHTVLGNNRTTVEGVALRPCRDLPTAPLITVSTVLVYY